MSSNPRPTKEIIAKKLDLACRQIRLLPIYRDHPAQKFNLLLACNEAGYRPLHCASSCGNIELVTLLANIFSWFSLRTALDARDCHGFSALHWATMKGFGAVIQTLVESGASLNLVDNQGRTPLHLAVAALEHHHSVEERKFCRDMIRYFLEHGANPDVGDENGTCPIHLAAEIGDEDALSLLVSSGASAHVRDNEGESAIFYAIRGPHLCIITKLVEEYKVDILSRNEDGENAAEYCESLGDMVTCRFIQSLSRSSDSRLSLQQSPQQFPQRRMNISNDSIDNSPTDDYPYSLSLSAGFPVFLGSLVVPSAGNMSL